MCRCSLKSSLVIANRQCDESRKSKPNHNVNARYRADTKWRFQFFAKYNYRYLLDVTIAIIATFLLQQYSLFHNYCYIFCISDNRDYFLYKINPNNLGMLMKCILQNNNETFRKTIMILQYVLRRLYIHWLFSISPDLLKPQACSVVFY